MCANYKPTDTLSASGFYTGILQVIDVVCGGVGMRKCG